MRVDFRLIAATNQNLEEMVGTGTFRKDLLYRLNAIWLNIPPLRERRKDITPLSLHILNEVVIDVPRVPITIDKEAETALREYDWPGNVRELSNVLERQAFSLDGNVIRLKDLPFRLTSGAKSHREPSGQSLALRKVLEKAEREAIVEAIATAKGNKALASRLLGIHRTLLYKKMNRHGLSQSD